MEFKKLSDVEVVAEPIESANVLIEENGVIKKAPKAAVGGAGGSESGTVAIGVTTDGGAALGVSAPDGLYEKLQTMFNDNVCIDIVIFDFEASRTRCRRSYMTNNMWKSDNIFEAWFSNGYHFKAYPNDTIDFYYDD